MRDPATRVDPDVEAAIAHAMKLLTPFVNDGAFRHRDPPYDEILKALKAFGSMYPGRRRIDEMKRLFAEQFPEIRHSSGHPAYLFRRAVILLVIDEIKALGFDRRRNQANHDRDDKRASACSIVSRALGRLDVGMTEAAVAELVRPLRPKKRARR